MGQSVRTIPVAIPEHVKRQAMDAVSHRETTAQIRAFRGSGSPASPGDLFSHRQEPRPESRPIPEHVKKQAMDAVSHRETTAQIRLMRDTGSVQPPVTMSRGGDRVADKVIRMHREGNPLHATHKTMTQDHFGEERG